MAAPDRKAALIGQSQVTGIDFVYVGATQVVLDVYFLNDPLALPAPLNNLQPEQVLIYDAERNEPGQEVAVTNLQWVVVGSDNVLRITTAEPGDFKHYIFALDDARVDRYFNQLPLDFKANCPSDLDCKQPPHDCPPEDWVDFPIDYQARDFDSFRQALQDFASLRYPSWTDRLEADAGIMLMEVMSALGDEMSYYQDRVGREAHMETATQRRSVRRHARLLDYEMHDGLGASTWLEVTARPGGGDLLAGSLVWAMSDSQSKVPFEIGRGIADMIKAKVDGIPKTFHIHSNRNTFSPYSWDEDDVCLPEGATELYIQGHHAATLRPGNLTDVERMLLKCAPSPGVPGKVHCIELLDCTDEVDPLFATPITRLTWSQATATPFEMDLEVLTLHGNVLPVVAGMTIRDERFIVGADPDLNLLSQPGYGLLTRALERGGPGDVPIYLFSLQNSAQSPLVWEGNTPELAEPAIAMRPVSWVSPNWVAPLDSFWDWSRSLLGSPSSQPNDTHYTLDDGIWRRVVGYQRPAGMFIHQDYATGAGKTVRFGDGEFGLIPAEGAIFELDYRLGNGTWGNVPAESIVNFDTMALPLVAAISNPFAVTNGQAEESIAEAKAAAPQAFRAVTYRAVRPEDYAEAAQRLPWVQKAGASFRWTGSWLSGFVTPDPKGMTELLPAQRKELEAQMERFRQAGREVYVNDPIYANIDLEVMVCLQPDAFAGEVKTRILQAMFGKKGPRPVEGYFSPDRFTFGTPLRRSALEAAIQAVPGVKAVEAIRIRRRGWFDWRDFTGYEYRPGKGAIIRINNDLRHPDQGTLKISTHGGA